MLCLGFHSTPQLCRGDHEISLAEENIMSSSGSSMGSAPKDSDQLSDVLSGCPAFFHVRSCALKCVCVGGG